MAGRGAMTLRLPEALAIALRSVKGTGESLNDVIVEATAREVRRREWLQADAEIRRLRAEILSRTGPQPDSTPLIRELREGVGRRD